FKDLLVLVALVAIDEQLVEQTVNCVVELLYAVAVVLDLVLDNDEPWNEVVAGVDLGCCCCCY
ncbi:MAG: hypothetical protein ACKPKO_34845, partial [Candidatus Fonsibacter sp.]